GCKQHGRKGRDPRLAAGERDGRARRRQRRAPHRERRDDLAPDGRARYLSRGRVRHHRRGRRVRRGELRLRRRHSHPGGGQGGL
ncbi:MAG: hypothetical protein AVDCRST_MAG12-1851, partial [uncultured Rubrobacteraceae bacterium]